MTMTKEQKMTKTWKSLLSSFAIFMATFIFPAMLHAQDDGGAAAPAAAEPAQSRSALSVISDAGWIGYVLILLVFVGFGLFTSIISTYFPHLKGL